MNNQVEFLGKAGIIVEDWDIRNKYPYKTFTTDYTTWISYISRKPIPAGTPITDINYWKPVLKPSESMRLWLQDIDNKIDSFLHSIGGTAISTQFGDSDLVAISQRIMTDAVNKIWDKLDELTGESHREIKMIISPDFFIGDECTITMAASAAQIGANFDYIEFLIDGEPFEGNNASVVSNFACTTKVTKECDVTCNATILGKVHTVSQHIGHNDSFWLGAGNTYNDIFDLQHTVRLNNFKGNYNIPFAQDNYLFVIVPNKYSNTFIRADLNGFEIPMERSNVTINGEVYIVYKSINSYTAGTYNIDINS